MRGNVRKIVRIVSCIMKKRFLKLIMKKLHHDRKKTLESRKIMIRRSWKIRFGKWKYEINSIYSSGRNCKLNYISQSYHVANQLPHKFPNLHNQQSIFIQNVQFENASIPPGKRTPAFFRPSWRNRINGSDQSLIQSSSDEWSISAC